MTNSVREISEGEGKCPSSVTEMIHLLGQKLAAIELSTADTEPVLLGDIQEVLRDLISYYHALSGEKGQDKLNCLDRGWGTHVTRKLIHTVLCDERMLQYGIIGAIELKRTPELSQSISCCHAAKKQASGVISRLAAASESPELIPECVKNDFVELFTAIQQQRHALKLPLYSDEHALILLHEMCVAYRRHASRPRHTSGQTYYDHVIGTAKELVKYVGLTGLETILAAIKHDDIEDRERIPEAERKKTLGNKEYILDLEQFKKTKVNFSFRKMQYIQNELHGITEGLSKVRRLSSKEKNHALTMYRLLQTAYENGLRVVAIKLADRLNNLRTVDSHEPEKKLDILRETWEVYIPLARFLGLSEMEEQLSLQVLTRINPTLLAGYNDLSDQRLKKLKDQQDEVSKQLQIPGRQLWIERDHLSKFLKPSFDFEKLAKLNLENLGISQLNTLSKFVVLVPTTEIKNMTREIEAEFSDNQGTAPTIKPKQIGSGNTIRLYNAELGEWLKFEVTDYFSHRLQQRGVIGQSLKQKNDSEILKKALQKVLAKFDKEEPEDFENVIRQELFRPWITVFTPQDEAWTFQADATFLDFARKVHSSVLINASTAFVSSLSNQDEKVRMSIYERIPPDSIVAIETGSKCRLGPEALLFAHGRAHNKISNYLELLEKEEKISLGANYAKRLQKVFGLTPAELRHSLVFDADTAFDTEAALYRHLGEGKINVLNLKTIQEKFATKDTGTFILRVRLPEEVGQLEKFLQRLVALGINLDAISQKDQTIDLPGAKVKDVILKFKAKHVTPYNLMKEILRLKYIGYEVSLRKRRPSRRKQTSQALTSSQS